MPFGTRDPWGKGMMARWTWSQVKGQCHMMQKLGTKKYVLATFWQRMKIFYTSWQNRDNYA